jgi:hypothetical protein
MEWWQIQDLMITLAVIVGVLVPVFALTYRLLMKPVGGRSPRLKKQAQDAQLRDERLDQMQRQLEDMEGLVRRLVEATELDRQLKAARPPGEEA